MVFNDRVAEVYGVENAVMIQNIWWWVETNRHNRHNYFEGCYWSYMSQKAFTGLFKFWTLRQVQRILENCQKQGAIRVANFNNSGYNRTNWYTVSDEVNAIYVSENLQNTKRGNALHQTGVCNTPNGVMDTPKPCDGKHETGVSYTDINTDINTNINTDRESAIAFLKREYSGRYESEILMKYQTALGADFPDWENSFNSTVVIELENNKITWTATALIARAQKYADSWIRNNKARQGQQQHQYNVVPAAGPKRSVFKD